MNPGLKLAAGSVLALLVFAHACPAQEVYGELRPSAPRLDTLRQANIASIFFDKSINTYHAGRTIPLNVDSDRPQAHYR
ncbi:MAG: hypothetical protein AUI33_05415 [Ignavibacteria bacterium 13_1_40CM_2_61_4]|nr:MAG: hypothetical protein AUI33_05415 [Ignavibacteria bacterium 13_1_40CM_2_61_4]